MQMRTLLLLLPLSSLFFLSCASEEVVDYGFGEYYQELATVLNDSAYMLDTGQTLCNKDYKKNKTLDAGKRVLLTYSYEKQNVTSYNFAISLHGLSEIILGELNAIAKNELDDFPTEPVRLESVWIGSHYLNVHFYFNYHSTSHSIGLFSDSTQLHADTVPLYFVHDSKGDLPGYAVHSYLSFDLEKVLGSPENRKNLLLNINTTNYANKTYEFRY
jgi:hypothetical protein